MPTLQEYTDQAAASAEAAAAALDGIDPAVDAAIEPGMADDAPLASPALTGAPTAPTAAQGNDSAQLATTAFVRQELTAFGPTFVDPTRPVALVDDFMCGSLETGELGLLNWNLSSMTAAATASVSNHPGVVALASSAVADTNCAIHLTNHIQGSAALFDAALQEATFIFKEAVAGITDVDMRVGLCSLFSLIPPSRGVWLEKLTTDANWHLVCQNAGSPTRTNTGVAAGTTGWIKARFRRVTTNDYRVSINGAAEVAVTSNTPSINIPFQPGIQMVPRSANSRVLHIDFFSMLLAGMTR